MDRSTLVSDPGQLVLETRRNSVLQELEKHGYVVEPHDVGSGFVALCRHPAAPSMLVGEDGRLQLLEGQPYPQARTLSQFPVDRIRWPRVLLFIAVLAVIAFVGLLLVGMLVG
jgi:ABC-type Fe3+-siderophore transport system permease subunit